VSLEWLAYLAFPVLALVIFRVHARLPTAVLAVLAVVPILSFVAYCGTQHPVVHPPWVFTSELAVDFLTGAVLYLLFTRLRNWPSLIRRSVRWTLSFGPPAFVVGLCLALPHLMPAANVSITEEVPYYVRSFITPLFALWVLALALQSPGPRRFLASRALVLGGFVSYSLYMIQFDWLRAWVIPVGLSPQGRGLALLWVLGLLASLLVVAFLTWRFVEESARELIRRLVRARPKPAGEEQAEFWRAADPKDAEVSAPTGPVNRG
jgi:peptidoglycan/LPS O-acetylase OafA/YrhL